MTYLTPSSVREVSAMLVAMMTWIRGGRDACERMSSDGRGGGGGEGLAAVVVCGQKNFGLEIG